jgi:hypothetical protein
MTSEVPFAAFLELDLVSNRKIVSNTNEFERGSEVCTSSGGLGSDIADCLVGTSMFLSKECQYGHSQIEIDSPCGHSGQENPHDHHGTDHHLHRAKENRTRTPQP